MILTEEEAKTKRCQESFGPPMVPMRDRGELSPINCIGSACMAWREVNRKLGHDPNHKGAAAAAEFTKQDPLRGYCGKAGKP